MTSSPSNKFAVFCDWLDVTYAPDDCPYPDLNALLLGAGFEVSRDQGSQRLYLPPSGRGAVKVLHSSRFAKVSLSGASCAALRSLGLWDEALWILSTSPHKVTRVDAALDLPMDAAGVIAALEVRYPDGWVNLGRKAQKVTEFLSVRADGKRSGTFYVGHKDAGRQSARVYDKSLEALEKRGEVLPTTTRVEVTARKDKGATLRDAALPEALFWHIAAPSILKAPEGVPMWVPNTEAAWTAVPRAFNPTETLRRRVESSAELDALLDLAASVGPEGRNYLLKLLEARVASAPVPEALAG